MRGRYDRTHLRGGIYKIAAERREQQKRAALIENDFLLLADVIRKERTRIKARDHNRTAALAAYHASGDKRRLRIRLEGAMRRALRRKPKPILRLALFKNAVTRIVKRHNAAPEAKLRRILRRRFEKLFRLKTNKSRTTQTIVGCSMSELRAHLERQFLPGMTWDNHGFYGWHVDHKQPLASFDLTQAEQVANAFHFSNLQPLWWRDNLHKSAKT